MGLRGRSCLPADALCPALHRHRAWGPPGAPAGAGAGPSVSVPWLVLGVCLPAGPSESVTWLDPQHLSPGRPLASVPRLHRVGERAPPCLEGSMFYRKAKRGVRVCGCWRRSLRRGRRSNQREYRSRERAGRRSGLGGGSLKIPTGRFPFAFRGVCVCMCTHMHMCARTHTHTCTHSSVT